jgi:hypothetical protein
VPACTCTARGAKATEPQAGGNPRATASGSRLFSRSIGTTGDSRCISPCCATALAVSSVPACTCTARGTRCKLECPALPAPSASATGNPGRICKKPVPGIRNAIASGGLTVATAPPGMTRTRWIQSLSVSPGRRTWKGCQCHGDAGWHHVPPILLP